MRAVSSETSSTVAVSPIERVKCPTIFSRFDALQTMSTFVADTR